MDDEPDERKEGDELRPCVRTRSIRALLLVLAAATATAPPIAAFGTVVPLPWVLVAAISAVMALAGLLHKEGRKGWRLLATVALMTWVAGTTADHSDTPMRGLIVMLGTIVCLAHIWPAEKLRLFAGDDISRPADRELLLATLVAALFGLDEWKISPSQSAAETVMLSAMYAIPVAIAAGRGLFKSVWERLALGGAALFACMPATAAAAAVAATDPGLTPLGLFAMVLMLTLVARPHPEPNEPTLLDTVLIRPSRVLVLSFVIICMLGTLLLRLPTSAAGDELSWLDAAFTAVSATCVTGLAVADTPTAFSGFGQLMVLLLIQVGGLGIMVFSAAALVLLGKRLSLSHERAAVDIVGATGRAGLVRSLKHVLMVTVVTEVASAALLFAGFLARGEEVGMAAWRAVFTAISAFCNAGFALQSDSLVAYSDSPFILSVTAVTIVVGGLGPAVIAAMFAWRNPAVRSLHARLVLWTTALLLAVPAVLILALEWNNTLGDMSFVDKFANAAFQSVTLRTAGFNSIDLAAVSPATWTIMILVMFVGGSPGSTAGGAKTTTFAVVILAIIAVVRGRDRVEAFGRTLPLDTVLKATAVTAVGVLGCSGALIAIQVTQVMPLDTAVFEVVSALATVGLTTGGTAALDEVGKVIIIACMFAGRVGPLTLFVFLASNTRRTNHRFPEEPVPIG